MKRIAIASLPGRTKVEEFQPLFADGALDAHWVRIGPKLRLPSDQALDERGRKWADFDHYTDVFPNGVDMIILPGSFLTLADLNYHRAFGSEQILRQHLGNGGTLLGICGGYQVLGNVLCDPLQLQGGLKEGRGFGLLPVNTLFGPTLISTATTARCLVSPWIGKTISGAECRRGFSWKNGDAHGFSPLSEVVSREMQEPLPPEDRTLLPGVTWAPGTERLDGFVSPDRKIWGTYLHQVLHGEAFRQAIFSCLP